MGSDLPKVLLEVAGRPMLWWVVDACREAGVSRCIIVIGYRGDLVRQAMASHDECLFVEQTEQLGTGHAAQMAQPLFENIDRDVFVLAGDGPLIRGATLDRLLQTHHAAAAAATLATAVVEDPNGYGRIVRKGDGEFQAIVEQKDATRKQLEIREINPSYYCFNSRLLFDALGRVGNNNRQREYYLTDVPALLQADGRAVTVVDAVPADDVLSINTPDQLQQVDRILQHRQQPQTPSIRQRT
jgi:UDP-N-acetylglucosamine diphosphorylase/glucosamine-1-phosphate N-acetyltransferase